MLPGNYLGARDLLTRLGVAQGWKELNPAFLHAQRCVGQVLEEKHLLQQRPHQAMEDKKPSARATTSYCRDEVTGTGNFFWQGSAHGLGPSGVKLSIKPCPINLAYINRRIRNVNTHASGHKVTTKCLVLKRNFLLSNLFPIFWWWELCSEAGDIGLVQDRILAWTHHWFHLVWQFPCAFSSSNPLG